MQINYRLEPLAKQSTSSVKRKTGFLNAAHLLHKILLVCGIITGVEETAHNFC